VFKLSRWAGAVLGLVLAVAALGLNHHDDGAPILVDGALPAHSEVGR